MAKQENAADQSAAIRRINEIQDVLIDLGGIPEEQDPYDLNTIDSFLKTLSHPKISNSDLTKIISSCLYYEDIAQNQETIVPKPIISATLDEIRESVTKFKSYTSYLAECAGNIHDQAYLKSFLPGLENQFGELESKLEK